MRDSEENAMTMTRMQILLAAVLTFVGISPLQAQRGPYPAGPVRIIVGFPPGGGVDVVARLIAQKMPGVWGQQVVVENRPGASSVIATRLVASAAPDGYNVLINSNSMLVNQVVNPNAGYDVERQLIPILNVAWQPNIIVAAPGLPVTSLENVVSLSRTRKLSYGTPGQGSIPHLAGVYLFEVLAKTDVLHVPYSGAAPALGATVAGQIDLAFVTLPPATQLVKAGKVKGIAVTSAKRASALPDVPTVAESGFPGYEVNVFAGFFMPAGTPKSVVDRFREAVLKVIDMPDIKEQLSSLGFDPADTSSDEFRRLISDEIRKWAKVVETTHIKIE
jgi:tripartite-type tricarboxylate transporter receptor subunit TctC